MITEERLSAFLDDGLDAGQRQAVQVELEHDPGALRFVLEQRQLDRVLDSLLGATNRRERLKESILAALAGATTDQLRAQVLADTSGATLQASPVNTNTEAPTAPAPDERPSTASAKGPRAFIRAWIDDLLGRLRSSATARLAFAASVVMVGAVTWFITIGQRPAAGAEVGVLAAVVGNPELRRLGEDSAFGAQVGTPMRMGDRLETGDADRAEIRFQDGTTLRLAFNTTIDIRNPKSDIRNPQSPPVRPSEIHLLQGQVWTKVQTLTNAPEYAIRTDVATAVARGTEFGVRLQRVNAVPSNLLAVLTVKEGTVDFFNSFGSVQATAMTESTATVDSAPTEPKRLETLQVVRLDDSTTWSLLTAALDWPEAAEKLVGGGGTVGWQLRDMPGADGHSEVRISQLPSGSPSAQAGLRIGDTIVAVDGQPVTRARQVAAAILLRPNGAVNFRVRREAVETTRPMAVTEVVNTLRGPSLSAETHTQLVDLLRQWLDDPLDPPQDAAAERRRLAQAAALSRSNPVRAAAFNQLGVAFELEDTLGPAVRAYGRAVYLEPDIPLYRFNLALALRKIGSFERALEEFEIAARLEPGSGVVQKRLAEIHSLLERNDEALALTDAALETHPEDHGLWELKAQVFIKTSRAAEAVEAARRAAELDPECPIAHAYLAEALYETGRLAEAEAAYTEAIERAPMEAALHMNFGIFLRSQGRLDLAEQSLGRAVELDAGFALAWFNLGDLCTERGDIIAAETALNRAAELDPYDAHTRRGQGMLALKQRQYDAAEAAFHAALTLAPHDPEVFYGLGELERLRGRSAAAERAYLKAIDLQPNYAAAHTALGIVNYERGDTDEAERYYRRAIELNPARPAPYHNLGNLYRGARGDLAAAEHWYQQALQLAPDDPDSLGGLGLVALERGDLDDAERLSRRAWKQNPDSSTLNNNLGEILRRLGRLGEAEPFYRKALELDPENRAAYGNLGILYAMRQEFAEAESMFRNLLERLQEAPAPKRLPTLLNLAIVCRKQGKLNEAEQLLRQALELGPENPVILNSLAFFLADHQLKLDEALELATRASSAAPNNPYFLDTLGWVHAQRGELGAAERALNRALSLAGDEPPASEIHEHLKALIERQGTVPE